MTYEKHTTHTDALDTLGSIISEDEGRDAIHLAVYPCEAAGQLTPGEHVQFNKEGRARHAASGEGVGIVDPFLLDFVKPGEWFWLVVYPRQITSLRHVWEHESFPASTGGPTPASLKDDAETWIRAWLPTVDLPYTFEEVIEALTTGRSTSSGPRDYGTLVFEGGEFYSGGIDAYGTIPDEFWDHAETFTGKKFTERSSYFSCSC